MVVGVLLSRVRVEEKLLARRAGNGVASRSSASTTASSRSISARPTRRWLAVDVVLERCINHLRALYTLRVLNDWGVPTVNSYDVANICGDKLLTSTALERAGVPQPRTIIAFTPEIGAGGL